MEGSWTTVSRSVDRSNKTFTVPEAYFRLSKSYNDKLPAKIVRLSDNRVRVSGTAPKVKETMSCIFETLMGLSAQRLVAIRGHLDKYYQLIPAGKRNYRIEQSDEPLGDFEDSPTLDTILFDPRKKKNTTLSLELEPLFSPATGGKRDIHITARFGRVKWYKMEHSFVSGDKLLQFKGRKFEFATQRETLENLKKHIKEEPDLETTFYELKVWDIDQVRGFTLRLNYNDEECKFVITKMFLPSQRILVDYAQTSGNKPDIRIAAYSIRNLDPDRFPQMQSFVEALVLRHGKLPDVPTKNGPVITPPNNHFHVYFIRMKCVQEFHTQKGYPDGDYPVAISDIKEWGSNKFLNHKEEVEVLFTGANLNGEERAIRFNEFLNYCTKIAE